MHGYIIKTHANKTQTNISMTMVKVNKTATLPVFNNGIQMLENKYKHGKQELGSQPDND